MVFARHSWSVIAVLALNALVANSLYAQEAAPKRKLSNVEKAHYEALKPLTDEVIAGKRPAPTDATMSWHGAFLRSAQDVYSPFTIQIEPDKFTSFPLGFYIRAVKRPGAPPPQAPAAGAAPAAAAAAAGPFEDIALIADLKGNTFSRALQLTPGTYDVYVAVRDNPTKGKNVAAPKVSVLKQEVQVPDLFKGLALSSVILADDIQAAPDALSSDDQLRQPFVISGYRITPSLDSTFSKAGQFSFVFFVYNQGAAANDKPDVDLDLAFYKGEETTSMVRMKPQSFNAQTLPPEFSMKLGHMLSIGQSVPLTSFEPGPYRFEIKATDKTNSASVTHSVNFTVTP